MGAAIKDLMDIFFGLEEIVNQLKGIEGEVIKETRKIGDQIDKAREEERSQDNENKG